MNRQYSLRKNKQFQYVYRKGKPYPSHHAVLLIAHGPAVRVGFVVGKKIGGAVTRNLVKRRMRENFRLLLPTVKPGNYVFVVRPPAAQADYHQLGATIRRLLAKADALLPEAP